LPDKLVEGLGEYLDEVAQTIATCPLTVEQNLALRGWLIGQGLVREGDNGPELVDDLEDPPLERSRRWLTEQGLDVERVLQFWAGMPEPVACDTDVLFDFEPLGLFDALDHWALEGTLRRLDEDEDEEEQEDWTVRSPSGRLEAVFDDDGDVAYLYVYDRLDAELVAPPLWLYNRQVAAEGEDLQPGKDGGAPLMPACCMVDSAPRTSEIEEVELLWTDDSARVAVKVDGEFLGFIDVAASKGYAFNLCEETAVGVPWPEGLPWETSSDEEDEAE
jgi:hypothetical protein